MDSSTGTPESGSAAVLELARKIADEVLAPAAMEVESAGMIPASHLDLLAASGLYGLVGPRAAGGLGVEYGSACRVIELLAGGCLSTAFVWMQHLASVRAVAASTDNKLRDEWLAPLCHGQRKAGVALAGAMPGPPRLRALARPGGYIFDGISPWVTGWGHIDTLYAAARDESDHVVWGLLDLRPEGDAGVSAEPLDMVAVRASQTVQTRFEQCFVPAERIVQTMRFADWTVADAAGLRTNGSLALGVAARCCQLLGPGPLDAQLAAARDQLDAGTPQTLPAARAAAAELAWRAAGALVVATGSAAILTSSQAQRLAREAAFLLVFASRPGIKTGLGELLTTRPA